MVAGDFMNKVISAIVLTMFLFSCAPRVSDTTTNPVVSTNAYISDGAAPVAYVLNLKSSKADIYIPTADKYATIDLVTGQYVPHYAVSYNYCFYYSAANCTGNINETNTGVNKLR